MSAISVTFGRSSAGCRNAPPGPILMPSLMFSGTAPTPAGNGLPASAPLRSASQVYPISAAALTKEAVHPSQRADEIEIVLNRAEVRQHIGP